ncbi:FAD-binding oxidoreductase [Rhizobium sp. TRM95111]|uniref:NAD(P)/FAD-dependent oxidoreductase n=1 Tax=Rhizobium alarense TaxID=2846851 RepID=UPI001F189692|nr:FAD-dependent oxidoreductase [Rhizobium alarense]MCF3639451.1 FAD-binding oxidoreductase [Rhizobium alarense]
MTSYDIAIIGGGIAGASLACFLAPQRSVLLIERETAPGYHSTGRSAAEFTLRDNAPAVNALARASHGFMMTPPDGFAESPLLARRGAVLVGTAGQEAKVEAAYRRADAAGAAVLRLTTEQALARVPFLDPDYLAAACFDPDYWDIDVDQLLQGYLRGARRHGATVTSGAELCGARHDGRRWTLETTAGAFAAATMVNAAGAWADAVAAAAGVQPLGIVPHRRTAITVDLPNGTDAAALPEVSDIADRFYFKPDAGRLLVSPADETPCEAGDAQPEELDVAYAAHYLEEATTLEVRRIASSWAGLRSFAPDRLPVVGPARDHPAFFWLAGQGGSGILTSPALGQLAAALLAGGPLPAALLREGVEPGAFSPARLI